MYDEQLKNLFFLVNIKLLSSVMKHPTLQLKGSDDSPRTSVFEIDLNIYSPIHQHMYKLSGQVTARDLQPFDKSEFNGAISAELCCKVV